MLLPCGIITSMQQQYVFIDDSGDPGFRFNKGSTRYFVIVSVIFEDAIDTEFAGVSIKKLKRDLGWKPEHEFKFNKNTYAQRIALLKAARKYDFKIRAVVVDKMKLSKRPKTDDAFYRFIIREMLSRNSGLKNANIYIDGSAGKDYRNRAAGYLRHRLNESGRKMSALKFVNSKNDTLIQLADVVAGSLRRRYDAQKTDKMDYYNTIKTKIEDIWEYEQ